MLMFKELPTGITIEPAEPMIKRDENEVKFKVSAGRRCRREYVHHQLCGASRYRT